MNKEYLQWLRTIEKSQFWKDFGGDITMQFKWLRPLFLSGEDPEVVAFLTIPW